MTPLVLAVTGALLWAPGAVLARLHGVPGRWALLLGPALTWGVVVVGSVLVPRAGLRWGPGTALAVLALLCLPAVVRRRRVPGSHDHGERSGGGRRAVAVAAGGVAAAGAVMTTVLWRAGVSASDVNQFWDGVWHANLTTWIAATGDSDPTRSPGELMASGLRPPSGFYPDALHALAALVVQLTGADAVLALGSLMTVVYVVLLPAAVAALTWALTRGSGPGAAAGALVSVLPVAYPTDQWWRSVWPYGAALAVAVLAAALLVLVAQGRLAARSAPAGWLLGALAVVGVAGLQPAGAVVVALLAGGWALGRVLLLPWRRAVQIAVPALTAVTLVPAALAALEERSAALGSMAAFDYRTLDSPLAALRQVLGLVRQAPASYGHGLPDQPAQVALSALLLAALVVTATRRETAWLAAAWVLVVLAAADTVAPVAPAVLHPLTALAYSSPHRLMAAVAVVGAVLAGVAAARVAGWPWWRGHGPVRTAAVVAALAGAAALATGTVQRAEPRMEVGFGDHVVGPDQRAVMERLAGLPLPAGARVLNDPVDGSPWLYALTGVRPVFTHYDAGRLTPQTALLLRSLSDVDGDPAVQRALRDLGVCYVYANEGSVSGAHPRAEGFSGLDAAASLELVARQGAASAYRVLVPGTPCAGSPPGPTPASLP